MKKPITKRKISISINSEVYNYIEDRFENKSKYIENLIYLDILKCGKLKKNIIL